MKKLIAGLMSIMLVLAMLSVGALAEEPVDVTGKWVLDRAETQGLTMDHTMLSSMGLEMTITLNEDGTAEGTVSIGQDATGTWSIEGNEVTISLGTPWVFTLTEDDELVTDQMGNGTMILVREGHETAPAEGESNPNPIGEDGDLTGLWTIAYAEYQGIRIPMSAMESKVDMTLQFEADGNVTVKVNGMEITGTWKLGEGTVDVEAAAQAFSFGIVDGNLTMDAGTGTIVFYRGVEAEQE